MWLNFLFLVRPCSLCGVIQLVLTSPCWDINVLAAGLIQEFQQEVMAGRDTLESPKCCNLPEDKSPPTGWNSGASAEEEE